MPKIIVLALVIKRNKENCGLQEEKILDEKVKIMTA
jgi:hypothetical protein